MFDRHRMQKPTSYQHTFARTHTHTHTHSECSRNAFEFIVNVKIDKCNEKTNGGEKERKRKNVHRIRRNVQIEFTQLHTKEKCENILAPVY